MGSRQETEREVNGWFRDAERKTSSNIDPSSYPIPMSASHHSSRDKERTRSKMFSIYFDSNQSSSNSSQAMHDSPPPSNNKRITMRNRMSMKIAPSYEEALAIEMNAMSSQKPSKLATEDVHYGNNNNNPTFGPTDYGNGITKHIQIIPFWRQPRQLLYFAIFLSTLVGLSMQGYINLRFGGKIIQNGKWNSLLIHSNWFVASLSFTSLYSLGMMIWYYIKKPSLPRIPYSFVASSTLWILILDFVMHAFMILGVLGMTLDVGISFKSCYQQAIKYNFSNKMSCVMIQWAVALAGVSVFGLALVTAARIVELRKVGILGRK
ncbi:hypothetical protein HK098_002146 [Nowakowskiella sp. JEL0407]|nr:hypothetical protein HK098_002146 [Nowakowskiella sp. JEL0407]